jgi:two-component system sensor histidine kinase ChvG
MASAIAAARRALRHGARIRYRLLLVNLIVAIVPVAGLVFAEMYEVQLLRGLERDMVHQGELVRAMINAQPEKALAYEPMLWAAARDTRTRIRIVDAAGRVVADSHRSGPPEGAERPVPQLVGEAPHHAASVPKPLDVSERREIKTALAGKYGAATRLWENQDRVYLFSALPIKHHVVTGVVYVTRSTHDVKLELYKLRRFLAHLLAGTLAVTALLSLVLAWTIARPLGKLTKRAQRIAGRQPVDSEHRLGERADEIGQLARAVDAMTTELERRARDARTLAADISHELKNPLAGIRGAAELLREGIDDPEARERFLSMIIADAARLDRIVSRLFELARVEDDRSVALPVDLAELAHACAKRPWPVPVEVSALGVTTANGRGAQLAAAIENLVANATQFAAPGTTVHVRVHGTRVTVENHGKALSANAMTKVWDRFYTTRVESGGSGLGLSIVRSVALAHGGSVGVQCADGVTAFWFEIRAA